MFDNNQISDMFSKYKNTVYKIAYSYCKNSSAADDVLQDVFLRYIKMTPIFENEQHEKAWFIRVTINRCKTNLTSCWYKRTVSLEEGLGLPFEDKEQSSLFYAVMELAPKYKIPIHLYYYEDYSIKEIAEIISQNANTVSSRLFRARKLLEKKLTDPAQTNSLKQESGGSYAKKFV